MFHVSHPRAASSRTRNGRHRSFGLAHGGWGVPSPLSENRFRSSGSSAGVSRESLPNTELREDHVEQILDVDDADDPAKPFSSQP